MQTSREWIAPSLNTNQTHYAHTKTRIHTLFLALSCALTNTCSFSAHTTHNHPLSSIQITQTYTHTHNTHTQLHTTDSAYLKRHTSQLGHSVKERERKKEGRILGGSSAVGCLMGSARPLITEMVLLAMTAESTAKHTGRHWHIHDVILPSRSPGLIFQ